MIHPMRAFSLATLTPVALIALGALFGGWFVLAALIYMTVFAYGLDRLIARFDPPAGSGQELSAADRLSVILAGAHFVLLGLCVWALARADMGWAEKIGLFFAAGLFFGQVSNSNAHELIHRADRVLFRLGEWVYISLLFGHHTSAHPKIHHRFVASKDDPNSAREGESFYAFAPRAWWGSFRAGFEIEREHMRRAGRRAGLRHPYVEYVGGAVLVLVLGGLMGGIGGVVAVLGFGAYATMQLLLSDYVQHYGLVRRTLPGGKLEPVTEAHSWNSQHWFTSHLMLNAPRHSDHHAHPARPYPALALPGKGAAPMLPYSLPAMATMALVPSLWNRVMGRALANWRTTQGEA